MPLTVAGRNQMLADYAPAHTTVRSASTIHGRAAQLVDHDYIRAIREDAELLLIA